MGSTSDFGWLIPRFSKQVADSEDKESFLVLLSRLIRQRKHWVRWFCKVRWSVTSTSQNAWPRRTTEQVRWVVFVEVCSRTSATWNACGNIRQFCSEGTTSREIWPEVCGGSKVRWTFSALRIDVSIGDSLGLPVSKLVNNLLSVYSAFLQYLIVRSFEAAFNQMFSFWMWLTKTKYYEINWDSCSFEARYAIRQTFPALCAPLAETGGNRELSNAEATEAKSLLV